MSMLYLLFFEFLSKPLCRLRDLHLLVTRWVVGRSLKFFDGPLCIYYK